MAERKWTYGKSIEGGKVRYLSPSALQAFDAARGGCARQGYYKYVLGVKSPPTKSQEIGIALHEEIETYLKTGRKVMGSLAMSGFHAIPAPGDDLEVEQDIAGGTLEDAPLRLNGIPIVGFIDLIRLSRGEQGRV